MLEIYAGMTLSVVFLGTSLPQGADRTAAPPIALQTFGQETVADLWYVWINNQEPSLTF